MIVLMVGHPRTGPVDAPHAVSGLPAVTAKGRSRALPAVDSGMVTCPTCRAEVPPGARFCAECGQDLRLRGDERRVVTVLFADLVGYTALSETRDPEQVKNLVDGCFERLVADIDAFGGRVDKIIGDAIVALFGAPVAHEDDAERAVRAALRMQDTLADACPPSSACRSDADRREHRRGARRRAAGRRRLHGHGRRREHRQPPPDRGRAGRRSSSGAATHAATRRVVRYETLGAHRRQGPRGARAGAGGPRAPWRPPGYRPERNRAALIGRDAELGAAPARRRQRRPPQAGRACSWCSARPASASPAWPRSSPSIAGCDHDALVLEGRCVPYGEANVWWPVADAPPPRLRDPLERPRPPPRSSWPRSRCAPPWARARSRAEVDQVLQGLLYLMGYESDAARHRRHPSPRGGDQRGRHLHRAVLRAATGDRRPVRPPLGRRPRARPGRHAARAPVHAAASSCWPRPGGASRSGGTPPTAATTSWSSPSTPSRPRRRPSCSRELAGDELDSGLAAALLDRSGGNPFFLEELVTLLGEAGVVGGGTVRHRAARHPAGPGRRPPRRPAHRRAPRPRRLRRPRPSRPRHRHRGHGPEAPRPGGRAAGARVARRQGAAAPERHRPGGEVDVPLRHGARGGVQHVDEGRPRPGPRRHRVVDGGARGHRARQRHRPHRPPLRPGGRAHRRAEHR